MKKLALVAGLASVTVAANAAINFNLNNPYQTVAAPNSGTISVVFSGTITVLLPQFDVSSYFIELPSNGSVFLGGAIDPGFAAYVAGNSPGLGYSGNIFSIQVSSTTANGLYWLNNNSAGMSPLSEAIITASVPGATSASDNEFYGVNVVPEPGTMAALGLGAAALLRRRRKA